MAMGATRGAMGKAKAKGREQRHGGVERHWERVWAATTTWPGGTRSLRTRAQNVAPKTTTRTNALTGTLNVGHATSMVISPHAAQQV